MAKQQKTCPKCFSEHAVKSGIVKDRQRYKCKECGYHFTVEKLGKQIDHYYVTKALQLYIEGVSYREIERILGVSHVSVMNWVKQYNIKRAENTEYRPTYQLFSYKELLAFYKDPANLKGAGMIVTEVGDKYMMIRWERFRK
ncbi:helix-turn-helix domain-containing protein [Limibacter armeniacum]|uniref:IS1/IS1595 family N-terminal zinc-binding domain-containing protein n=1 Tax=Limibacter armeniacum TaxID=466084 RepID=UPI002FE5996D